MMILCFSYSEIHTVYTPRFKRALYITFKKEISLYSLLLEKEQFIGTLESKSLRTMDTLGRSTFVH